MKVDSLLPSFEGASDWLNRKTTPGPEHKTKASMSRITKGRPTLVHFWSLNCEASKLNLSQVADLRDQRKREGLRVIAVHLPQTEVEKDANLVRDAIERFNLMEPCALDNEYKLRETFLNGEDSIPA